MLACWMAFLTAVMRSSTGMPRSSASPMGQPMGGCPRITVHGVGQPRRVAGLVGGGEPCLPDRLPERGPAPQPAVELAGKVTRGRIPDSPQRPDERGRSRFEELARPAVELVVGRVDPRTAARVDEHG